jgi:hypothetical protein
MDMNQRTHAWLAIRAVALLEDTGLAPNLVELLRPHVKGATVGAWLPDMRDAKLGGADTDNHVFKMEPYTGRLKSRFTLKKDKLIEFLGPQRRMSAYLENDQTLDDTWWKQPYKADPQPGQHLANRTMSLCTTLTDLLILGDREVAPLVPGRVSFAHQLDDEARSSAEQIATYFYNLSHFIADSCQPCHCDARKLAAYDNGLHKEMEGHWSKEIGTYFEKAKLLDEEFDDGPDEVLRRARAVDADFGLTFGDQLPSLRTDDIWTQMVMICRGSFAVNSILVPPGEIPYDSDALTDYDVVFAGDEGEERLAALDEMVLHDAVANIVFVWTHIWKRFK